MHGEIGLKSLSHVNLEVSQMASLIKSLKRVIKKKNFLIVHALPYWSVTRKPRDVRMGRGKGTPSLKVFPVRAGKIVLEIKNTDEKLAKRALKVSLNRFPAKVLIVKRDDKCTNSIESCW